MVLLRSVYIRSTVIYGLPTKRVTASVLFTDLTEVKASTIFEWGSGLDFSMIRSGGLFSKVWNTCRQKIFKRDDIGNKCKKIFNGMPQRHYCYYFVAYTVRPTCYANVQNQGFTRLVQTGFKIAVRTGI